MANGRMFSRFVIDQDCFLSLQPAAQALYLHLAMSADDDGFTNQIYLSKIKAHAGAEDLQALIDNGFIYLFGSVAVIIHWRTSNALRRDRYNETVYKAELSHLELQNGKYILRDGCQMVASWLPDGCQMVASSEPQLVEVNKVNNNNINNMPETASGERPLAAVERHTKNVQKPDLESDFDQFWKVYPRHEDRAKAFKAYTKARKDGAAPEEILKGAKRYSQLIQAENTEKQFIKLGATWLNGKCWENEYQAPASEPVLISTNQRYADLSEAWERQSLA